MSKTLKRLFDFQKFEGNSALEAMIKDTETRYGLRGGMQELSDDDLMFLNAAGDLSAAKEEDRDQDQTE